MKGATWASLVDLAASKGVKIAVVESCTGGLISSRLTDVPGASRCFVGGLVPYSNGMKEKVLGVGKATLRKHGAVSREAASELAENCIRLLKADIAVAVTGIAGPSGGTVLKPVGTVYISVASRGRPTIAEGFLLEGLDRSVFKEEASIRALGMLMGAVRNFPPQKP